MTKIGFALSENSDEKFQDLLNTWSNYKQKGALIKDIQSEPQAGHPTGVLVLDESPVSIESTLEVFIDQSAAYQREEALKGQGKIVRVILADPQKVLDKTGNNSGPLIETGDLLYIVAYDD